jgi:DeoR/GlpR family transcriptional regulator of sugar metabolism
MTKERIERLREYIDAHNEVTLEELAALYADCSAMTRWRDLNQLEKDGYILRTRGGAVSLQKIQPETEGVYRRRARENIKAKQAIAKAALSFVAPGSAVFFDAGSTLMELARLLPNEHYTVITSGANIAIELSQRSSCNVMGVGGQISANTLSFSGPFSEMVLDGMNIDTAMMATSGYSASSGFSSGSFTEHQLKKKVISKASRVVMLMDLSKIGKSLTFTFADFKDIDVLICDSPLPQEIQAIADRNGVRVIAAVESEKV